MTPADFKIARALADKLTATCHPSELWDEVEELTKEQCSALDSIVFECQTCNHWFPLTRRQEKYGNFYCKDCF